MLPKCGSYMRKKKKISCLWIRTFVKKKINLWLWFIHLIYFQQDNVLCNKYKKIVADWFMKDSNIFSMLKWPSDTLNLNPIEHFQDVVEKNFQILDVKAPNSEEFQNDLTWTEIVKLIPRNICAVLKAKEVQSTNRKAYLIKLLISVYGSWHDRK